MSITVSTVTPDFAAEVGDVDLTQPIPDADFDAIRSAFWKYAVLIFPGQNLTQEQHLAFSAKCRSRSLTPIGPTHLSNNKSSIGRIFKAASLS